MPARRQSDVSGIGEGPSEPKRRNREGKEKETFGCSFPGCGQVYSRMEYLKRHQRKHQDDRPFQCKDCAKAFARSDVLLRHRRRCHPTPPPADRSSHSPMPPHRAYPGVPVSSSRHDDYGDESPDMQGRKHARDSVGSTGDRATRPRLEEDGEDHDDQFGEASRFGRQNGMGNGGVYGVNSFYPNESDPSYTPHLLPIFQNTNVFSQQPPEQENHLEDASVLLSMAYPTGVPANENGNETSNGPDVVSDWETGQQTINMMMEQARVDTTSGTQTQNGSVDPTTVDSSQDTSPVLTEPINYLGAMSWLEGQGQKDGMAGGLQQWLNPSNPSPQPLSPFPFSSFISPSAFGIPLPTDESQQQDESNSNEGAVKSLMDMLAMYDIPQTRANPNPERPLLRIHHDNMSGLAGGEVSKNSRYYIPADRFAGCYQIPHWALPPLKTLSLMANRTCETVLQHFSFVHMPTFRLIDTAACLAFAICTVGGIRTTAPVQRTPLARRILMQHFLDGPAPPGSTWEDIYNNNYGDASGKLDPITAQVGMWKNGVIVRNEKSNMLVKSFSLAQGVLMTEYNVALLQALILYNAPYFLSEDESERHMANMFLGTIVNITRQVGFFNQELEHFDTEYQLPQEPHTPNDLDLYWRRWIQLETRRRTAYLVFHLDTISALESCIQCILAPSEISHLPLPAPDSIWKAETAEDWLKAIRNYRPMTLDEAMRRVFFLPTYGAFDNMHEKADTKYYHLLNESELGPFARVAMILTLLRGIIDIGEGKRDRGDWRDLTDLWMGCSWLKPAQKMLASDGSDLGKVTRESLRGRFSLGLQRWREGWDFDPTCMSPGQTGSTGVSPVSGYSRNSSSPPVSGKLNYCEEALPFYWLAQALLNLLNAAPPNEPGWNNFTGIKYNEMLKSSRTFTRMGEGVAPAAGGNGSMSGTGSTTDISSGNGSFDPMALFGDLSGLEGMVF